MRIGQPDPAGPAQVPQQRAWMQLEVQNIPLAEPGAGCGALSWRATLGLAPKGTELVLSRAQSRGCAAGCVPLSLRLQVPSPPHSHHAPGAVCSSGVEWAGCSLCLSVGNLSQDKQLIS